ncbi:MAG: RNA polymerase sigma factor [Sedimentisphaerales bacterium]|nr:RNA polymerase sigma factor [Sedimentisphaerales bacterium]
MIEDKILIWKFNRGSKDAFRRIYEKYKDDLLGLAVTLLRDRSIAEDVVHEVFISFAAATGNFCLTGTLKGFLSTCVANCARDKNKMKVGQNIEQDLIEIIDKVLDCPLDNVINYEESGRLQDLLSQLPYEQREVIVLHLHQEICFREISKGLGISINTVQSRYRYGLQKLRQLLNDTVTK